MHDKVKPVDRTNQLSFYKQFYFSNRCGGKKGASPNVKHKKIRMLQGNLSRNSANAVNKLTSIVKGESLI